MKQIELKKFVLLSLLSLVITSQAKMEYQQNPMYSGNYNTNPIIVPPSQPNNYYNTPVITHRSQMIHGPNIDSSVYIKPSCPCASEVKCTPCSGLYIAPKMVECPCAPKLNCPSCPPLSLIHKIAAKKAEQDARIATNVSNITFKLNQYLKRISNLSSTVIKLESQANEAARKMEEAFTKAQIARQKMLQTSDQAKYIASTTISGQRNGFNIPIGFGQTINMDPRALGRIFPEEISSVEDFLKRKNKMNLRSSEAEEKEEKEEKEDGNEEKDLKKVSEKGGKGTNSTAKAKKKMYIQQDLDPSLIDNYSDRLDSLD